jgi:ribosomal protein L37AE/L43A
MQIQDETPEPKFRYHCHRCSHETLAPRGQTIVDCEGCGALVGDTAYALDECRRSVEGLMVAMRKDEYARVDAEISLLLTTLPLELALERRDLRSS